jgi:hypothetical protein
MAMDWVRTARAKELRRMSAVSSNQMSRQMQHRDNRNITNGALTTGARQLGRVGNRPCTAQMGTTRGNCTKVG